MLLGYEYYLFSKIANCYECHYDGIYRIGEADFVQHFEHDDLKFIRKLEEKNLCSYSKGTIKINTLQWIELFSQQLQMSFKQIGYNFRCLYDVNTRLLHVFEDEKIKKSFTLNFSSKNLGQSNDTINFCFLSTFGFYIYWLDLLNDYRYLDMFGSYVKSEIDTLFYTRAIECDFFDGLDDADISEIFTGTIREYFKELGLKLIAPTDYAYKEVHRFSKGKTHEFYQLAGAEYELLVIKWEKRIIFLTFKDETLTLIEAAENAVHGFRSALLEKVNIYRSLSRKSKTLDNVKRVIEIIALFVTPFNVLLFIGTAFGNKFAKLWYLKVLLGGAVFVAAIYLLLYVGIPFLRLLKFEWRVNKKVN